MLILGNLAFVTLTALGACFLGNFLLKPTSLDSFQKPFKIVLCCALGLALLSYAIFFGVLLPAPNLLVVRGLALLMTLAAAGQIFRIVTQSKQGFPTKRFKGSFLFFLCLCTLYFFGVIAFASLPATARDELIYQLAIPKQLLQETHFPVFKDNFYAYFPQLANMWMLYGLGTMGELAAKLFHLLSGILLSFSLYSFFDADETSKQGRFFAVLLFLSVPSVMVVMPLAYVDLTYSLYAFLGIILWQKAIEKSSVATAFFGGLCVGFAAATKYTGIQFAIVATVTALLVVLFLKKRFSAQVFFAFLLPIGIGLFPYVLRNWIVTGWPLYPFPTLAGDLASNLNWDLERSNLYLGWLGSFGTTLGNNSLIELIGAPFLVFLRGEFNNPARYEGIIGPVFLLTPFFFQRFIKAEKTLFFMIFSILFLYFWSTTTKQVRFLIPLIPILSYLLITGISRSQFKRYFYGVLILGIGFSFYQGSHELLSKNPLAYWQGKESRSEYLRRNVSVYSIYQSVEEMLPERHLVLFLNMKNYGYYFDGRWTGDYVFERSRFDAILSASQTPGELLMALQGLGVTHILVDEKMLLSPKWGLESPEKRDLYHQFKQTYLNQMLTTETYRLFEIISQK